MTGVAHISGRPTEAELRVTADILRDASIDDRKMAYRALRALEASGALKVQRKRGRRPFVQLLALASRS